jgi:hypothetical protein
VFKVQKVAKKCQVEKGNESVRLRLPVQKVAVQLQALGRAFFRVKLRGKDVSAGHGAGKR